MLVSLATMRDFDTMAVDDNLVPAREHHAKAHAQEPRLATVLGQIGASRSIPSSRDADSCKRTSDPNHSLLRLYSVYIWSDTIQSFTILQFFPPVTSLCASGCFQIPKNQLPPEPRIMLSRKCAEVNRALHTTYHGEAPSS